MIRDDEKLEFVFAAFQEANTGAANERITYWLGKLDEDQLRRMVQICKRLVTLAENELHVERPVRDATK